MSIIHASDATMPFVLGSDYVQLVARLSACADEISDAARTAEAIFQRCLKVLGAKAPLVHHAQMREGSAFLCGVTRDSPYIVINDRARCPYAEALFLLAHYLLLQSYHQSLAPIFSPFDTAEWQYARVYQRQRRFVLVMLTDRLTADFHGSY